jgi:D-alanine-D-alanine ligase
VTLATARAPVVPAPAAATGARPTVAVVCGGQNLEHEVYLLSSHDVRAALDPARYRVVVLGIERDGSWRFSTEGEPHLLDAERLRTVRLDPSRPAVFPGPGGEVVCRATGAVLARVDAFFTVTMDPLQGLFESLGRPYVGTGPYGFAAGMDKALTKRLLAEQGVPVAPGLELHAGEALSYAEASARLGPRMFVKPCRLGNSIGVSEARDARAFDEALATAFRYDRKVLVERAIEGREVECALLGNREPAASSALCEIVGLNTFFTHELKSSRQNVLSIPAEVDAATSARLRDAARTVFRALECEGMGRVDFFLRTDGSFVVNEINVAPGLKRGYPYPRLWEASGVSYEELVQRLLDAAFARHAERARLEV